MLHFIVFVNYYKKKILNGVKKGYTLTSDPCCRLIESREQGKQNLWCGWEGHCTKCVSSSRSWQSVHFSSGVAAAPASPPSPASVDDTDVVDDTWREPDDRRPPLDPAQPTTRLARDFYLSALTVGLGTPYSSIQLKHLIELR